MGAPDLPLGLVYDLPIETYHADSRSISKTGLDEIARSPAIYRALRSPDAPPRPQRAGQLEGNLAHCAILEPAQLLGRYAVGPTLNRNTKAWKEFVDAHPTKIAIQQSQLDTALQQARSVNDLSEVRDALAIGRPEVSAYWLDHPTGVLCRCRPDWIHPLADNKAILVDVKTVSNASPREFALQVARKSYEKQAAFYTDGFGIAAGVDVLAFLFVAVESEYPYAASACMLDEESLDAGRRAYRRDLDVYAECLRTDVWPGYSDRIELISLPQWALQKEPE